jgi:rhodanese-related sulfurtransferase
MKGIVGMSFLSKLLGSDTAQATDVDVQTAHTLQGQGAVLIDVREVREFQGGHAQGARNIPLSQLAARAIEIPSDRTVLVICQSGGRSKAGVGVLKRQFADVRNVRGGTSAWLRAGLPSKH